MHWSRAEQVHTSAMVCATVKPAKQQAEPKGLAKGGQGAYCLLRPKKTKTKNIAMKEGRKEEITVKA